MLTRQQELRLPSWCITSKALCVPEAVSGLKQWEVGRHRSEQWEILLPIQTKWKDATLLSTLTGKWFFLSKTTQRIVTNNMSAANVFIGWWQTQTGRGSSSSTVPFWTDSSPAPSLWWRWWWCFFFFFSFSSFSFFCFFFLCLEDF